MSSKSSRMENRFRFIPYTGPPKSKSRRKPLQKVQCHEDVCLTLDEESSTRPAFTWHKARDINLASAGKNICELEEFGSGCGDVGCTGGLSPLDAQGVEAEHFVSRWFSKEVLRKGSLDLPPFEDSSYYDLPQNGHQSFGKECSIPKRTSRGSEESPGQSAHMKGSSKDYAVVIEDDQSDSNAHVDEDGDPREDDYGAQKHDPHDDAGLWASEHHDLKGMEDATSLELTEGFEYLVGGPPCCTPSSTPSTPPTRSSIVEIEQPTHKVSSDTLLDASAPQSQRLVHKMAEEQGKRAAVLIPSSGSGSNEPDSNTETEDDDDSINVTELIRNREQSPPAKRHSQLSNTMSKWRIRHVACSADQKPPSCGRRPANRTSRPDLPSAAQNSDHDTERYRNDNSGDSSSGQRLGTIKRLKPVRRSSEQRKRDRHVAFEDDEYEVEQILDARVCNRELQYRVKWCGYKVDRQWYPASNFKNSPFKLHEFHSANLVHPGPPKRLKVWKECFQEGKDADDHPDDNKPQT